MGKVKEGGNGQKEWGDGTRGKERGEGGNIRKGSKGGRK